MNRRDPSLGWAPVCAALCLLVLAIPLRQTSCDPSPARAVLPAPEAPPVPPLARKPPPDAIQAQARPAIKEDPWDFNYALQANGTTATGGARPELLIDGNTTVYDGSTGFAYTNWPSTPPPPFILTFKQGVRLNAVRFLLWDQDSRFYRYKLEASAALARDEWVLLADRTGETNQCRGWQIVVFKTQLTCRLRLTGTYNSANGGFHVVELEAYHIPAGQTCPWSQPEF